jgi:putative transposase
MVRKSAIQHHRLQTVDFQYAIFYTRSTVKLTARVKLLATTEQTAVLAETMVSANACCDWISAQAWKAKTFGQFALHKLTYAKARTKFELSAQVVVRCISKVCDAYKLDKKTKRTFWSEGAIAYDDRILSWNIKVQTVSIWTIAGRLRIPFAAGPRQLELLKSRQGESDLILHRGTFYLAATCNVDTPDSVDVSGFLGVDLGIVQIASTSDGKQYSGAAIKGVRCRQRRLRTKLQKKQTRGAKRKLRELSGKESRFAKDVNHVISKQIVEEAKRTKRTIVLEELKGIRARIRARRPQRAILHSWAFAKLGAFLLYKATLAGVPVIFVDPRNTSRECSACGHIDKANRPSQSKFSCLACGFTANADLNAARVIAGRGAVNRPNVARVA